VTDDPNSVADALAPHPVDVIGNAVPYTGPYQSPDEDARNILNALTAAGYEVVPAGTADRLAVAEAAHLATYETVSRRADAAEARLAALLDAIGDPDELADLTTLHPAWAHVELLRRIAAAVQPPDTNQPTRRVQ
jgi:hypothetical protein